MAILAHPTYPLLSPVTYLFHYVYSSTKPQRPLSVAHSWQRIEVISTYWEPQSRCSSRKSTDMAVAEIGGEPATVELEREGGVSSQSLAKWKTILKQDGGFDDFDCLVQDFLEEHGDLHDDIPISRKDAQYDQHPPR